MKRRTDIITLEEVPSLKVSAALAGVSRGLGRLAVRAGSNGAGVTVRWRRPDGTRGHQSIPLARYVPGLGGVATLFQCACGHRVRSVFLASDGTAWACRWCLNLRHRSRRVNYSPKG